ncbi:hypothetical protein [Anaerosporobacter faecicola]|uniref:hypothetical protein n=1 Tax=Anaerosporobacter faecicola TaxID=2718714 RepID=UPI00143B706B|nr:hypothetical protein [Anaerosporobacter faecicola]
MIKKYKVILLVSILALTACTNSKGKKAADNSITNNTQEKEIQSTEVEKAIKVYNEFLDNKISVGEIDMNFITIPTGEPNSHYGTKYALFDSNGDEIPELHICSARYYYVLTYINEKLTIFKNLSPYPQYYALTNGAFICHHFGSDSDVYNYYIFDYLGNEVWSLTFSKYDKNENNVYDKNDEYIFDEVKVSKKIWVALTEKYIYVNKKGVEKIRNEIEWTVIYEETT